MDLDLLDCLSKGVVLGLAAGFSPGPLTLLVISETLRHGLRAGVKVSLAPVLTDLPIIVLAALLLERLTDHPAVYGVITLAGGLLLIHMGLGGLRTRAVEIGAVDLKSRSLGKGIATNLLNPNPYIFWISVGTPIILAASERSWAHAAAFTAVLFFFLVGSKALLAWIVAGSRSFLSSRVYLWIMRTLGALLIAYALMFFKEGLIKVGVWPW